MRTEYLIMAIAWLVVGIWVALVIAANRKDSSQSLVSALHGGVVGAFQLLRNAGLINPLLDLPGYYRRLQHSPRTKLMAYTPPTVLWCT
ncbi:MAG: hypothetical protein KatS3mg107_0724 [Gemmataceae bacterium]|nr:MAG: hypothetical protein KatS3mg107_0724 [Gemmataceae bacterium]